MAKKPKGKVILVGAGPGDPGLLTMRGAEVLRSADAVVYDRLVNPVLLKIAAHAEKFFVGKDPAVQKNNSSGHPEFFPQEKINKLLIKLARGKKTVVRLKGGDPFIFGRGGEEASVLKRAGISFEIVPGISAGYAAPAYAGIPVTDRRFASAVTLLTAHEKQENWKELARLPGTLVFFMGVKTLPALVEALTQAGKSPATRVSVIEQGTLAAQRVVEGTLQTIARKIKKAGIQPPALAVIGQVNRLRRELNWFYPSRYGKDKPLRGKTVLITRSGAQSQGLKRALESEGAFVRDFPVIRILPPKSWKPLDNAIGRICHSRPRSMSGINSSGNPFQNGSPTIPKWDCFAETFGDDKRAFDWIIFTSVNGVDAFFQRLKIFGKDSRFLEGVRIAAIGEATRERLLENGIEPDLVPKKFTSVGLVSELTRKKEIKGRHFLLPRTDIAPPYLKEELEKRGAKITQVISYRTVPACGEREKKTLRRWLEGGEIDFVTFTSASTVDHFFALLPKQKRGKMKSCPRLISIGPVTSRALCRYGARPWREASAHTMKGMLEVLTKTR